MLIEFAVTNYRSFRERQVFSLLPSGKEKERTVMPLKAENYSKLSVLPTAVLYGPNNSGKSNLLRAVNALNWLVKSSGNLNSDKKLLGNDFFELNTQNNNQPTTFEIDFIASNKKRYNYILTFNSTTILKEELYVYNTSKTGKITVNTLFDRDKQTIKFPALKGIRDSINFEKNQLFLSRGDIAGNTELKAVYSFFAEKSFVIQFTENEYTDFLTKEYPEFIAKNPNDKIPKLVEIILQETETGILGINTNFVDRAKIQLPENASQEVKDKVFEQLKYELRTRHRLFNGKEEVGEGTLPLSEQSTGTRKLLGLTPLIITALINGATLFIDEMNTSLHTEMTVWLIGLFNNPTTNPNQAQLIITTHDTALIDRDLYQKDQIFIVNKDSYGASELYSFVDVKGLNRKINQKMHLSDYYEAGSLGGVPHISKPYLEHVISQFLIDAKTEEK